jgi:voltage-gated potassium channel
VPPQTKKTSEKKSISTEKRDKESAEMKVKPVYISSSAPKDEPKKAESKAKPAYSPSSAPKDEPKKAESKAKPAYSPSSALTSKKSSEKKKVPKHITPRKRWFQILNDFDQPDIAARLFNLMILGCILTAGVTGILGTVASLQNSYALEFTILEIICILGLTIDFLLRLWTSPEDPENGSEGIKRIRYLRSFSGVIDLLSFLPLVFLKIIPFGFGVFGLFQAFRMLVFLKLLRYTESFEIILTIIRNKREELIMTFILGLLLLFFSSVFLYYAEHDAQPEKFPNLFTSMYWAGITLATVGYGEIVPITPLGKMLASLVGFMGVILFVLPTSVIGSGFLEEIQRRNPRFNECPNCQRKVEETQILTDIKGFRKRKPAAGAGENAFIEAVPQTQGFYHKIQAKMYNLLENKFPTTIPPKIVAFFLLSLIGINALAIMIQTNPPIYAEFENELRVFEYFSIIVFSIEYLLRLWICTADPRYKGMIKGRIRYIFSPMGIIDLIPILPYYLALIFQIDVKFLQIFRVLVVFKVGHFSAALESINYVLKTRKNDLMNALFVGAIVWILCSTIMFYAEHEAQPETFTSIPASMWWGVITLTTVGYGDLYPITTLGRMISVLTAFLGVGLFALPAGILGAGFFDYMKQQRYPKICPHCGFYLSKAKIPISHNEKRGL